MTREVNVSNYEYTIGKEVDLRAEQEKTLASDGIKPNFILQILIISLDLVYGFKRTLPKFMVLEILARYPYWAWENGSYRFLSKLLSTGHDVDEKEVKHLIEVVNLGRESQDLEQWHMLILADIIRQKKIKLGWFKYWMVPRLLAFGYVYLTRFMFFVNPVWSYAMNAAFESHAERQYMLMVQENPAWDNEEIDSVYFSYYPRQKTLGDLLRRIALDERDHMYHSLEEIEYIREGGKR